MPSPTDNEVPVPRGRIRRAWARLSSPSARWSVLSLLALGLVVGAAATIGTHVMVAVTGTDAFCGGACHSMQWVAKEHRESVHQANRLGVGAGCHDCHIPKTYPGLLWYKAVAGAKDVVQEVRGVINTEAKFKKERLRMAQLVWDEYKANDSRACRGCHQFTPAILLKQKEFVRPLHTQAIEGKATCIDCHKGVAHTEPET